MFFIAMLFIFYLFIYFIYLFYFFVYLFIYFQRRYMHALMTTIATLGHYVNMENASVKERELETGKTAEVRAVGYQHGCN